MKVYGVMQYDYDDAICLGVYLSEANAELAARDAREKDTDRVPCSYHVLEWVVVDAAGAAPLT